MERIEENLKDQMKASSAVPHPDFDRMWSSIQQNKFRVAGSETLLQLPRPRKRKQAAIVIGLSVALMATPVYAAIQYDWGNLLSHRGGIQSALEQGLGQTIEQSITKNGVTLTLHTAFIDDNRTFLLYSLDPGATRKGEQVSFKSIGLTDQKGNLIEGNYSHQWNAEQGVFQGYFETEWGANGSIADVAFTMENMIFTGEGKQTLQFDPKSSKTQEFPIQKDGIGSVKIQSFDQSEGKTLLQSAITFTDPELQHRSWARIQAINDKDVPIQEAETPVFGTPGSAGEYLSQQIFKSNHLRASSTHFQLAYDRILGTAEGKWSLNLSLSKKQMENGTFKEKLNIPLEQVPGGTKIQEMIVTPTQIRLILTHEEKYTRVPYMNYQLDIGGTLLDGGIWWVPGQSDKTELRFEMTGLNAGSLVNKPIDLIAKYRVDEHTGDKNPIRLTNISAERQTMNSNIPGYPITWTYYMKDNNLYVESLSSDRAFGGVGQTYYMADKDREYGKPAMVGMIGSESNKRMDVYENFNESDLEIFIYNYTTKNPEDELRVQLKKEK